MKVVAFVAHPDDELLGIGGTLLRHIAAGDEVRVHIECIRGLRDIQERLYAAARVSVQGGWTLTNGYSDHQTHVTPEFETDADVVYTHHPGDLNRAHRLVAEAAFVAGRRASVVRTFETLSSTEWGLTPFLPDSYVSIDIGRKLELLREYGSEMREFPHPRSATAITALSAFRGSTAGLVAAEALHTVRLAWPLS